MTDEAPTPAADCIALASDIVAAYVSNNSVRAADLPGLIASVHATIAGIAIGGTGGTVTRPTEVAVEKPSPAQIRKSITHDGLVSFIDGKTYKTLKRHLTANGHTPESYRRAYGLPEDYPMVAASYSEQRSSLAKAIGLGVPGGRAVKARKAA